MREALIYIFLFICSAVCAQTHLEYVSEKEDSMALINKQDIDIINNVFNERNTLDSLHNLNEQIISNLEQKVVVLDSIITTQEVVILNDSLLVSELENRNKQTVEQYTKELKKEKRKKISFQSLTGAGIIAIILLILL